MAINTYNLWFLHQCIFKFVWIESYCISKLNYIFIFIRFLFEIDENSCICLHSPVHECISHSMCTVTLTLYKSQPLSRVLSWTYHFESPTNHIFNSLNHIVGRRCVGNMNKSGLEWFKTTGFLFYLTAWNPDEYIKSLPWK